MDEYTNVITASATHDINLLDPSKSFSGYVDIDSDVIIANAHTRDSIFSYGLLESEGIDYGRASREPTYGQAIYHYSFAGPLTFFTIAKQREGCVERLGLGFIRQSTIEKFNEIVRLLTPRIMILHLYLIAIADVLKISVGSLRGDTYIHKLNSIDSFMDALQEYTIKTNDERVILIDAILQTIQEMK